VSFRRGIRQLLRGESVQGEDPAAKLVLGQPFEWPRGLLHLLGILQDGFAGRSNATQLEIQDVVSRILEKSSATGTIFDQKWGLEVAGAATQETLTKLVKSGLESRSQWLTEVAYRQIAKLGKVPEPISLQVHKLLVNLTMDKRLFSQRTETYAFISRLDNTREYLRTFQLMLWSPLIDFILTVMGMAILARIAPTSDPALIGVLMVALILLGLRWLTRADMPLITFFTFVFGYVGLYFAVKYNPVALGFTFCVTWIPAIFVSSWVSDYKHLVWWLLYPAIFLVGFPLLFPIVGILIVLYLALFLVATVTEIVQMVRDRVRVRLLIALGMLVFLGVLVIHALELSWTTGILI
jgi:hypothetical protein